MFSHLSSARALSRASHESRWQPGLADQPFHSEIFASGDEASGAALALVPPPVPHAG